MGLPTNGFGLVVLIVVALPGFVFAAVRRWARGESPDDRDLSLSIARGAVFAIALTSSYLALFGSALWDGLEIGRGSQGFAVTEPRVVGMRVLVLYVLSPLMIALAINKSHVSWLRSRRFFFFGILRSRHGYSPVPNAWEHAVRKNLNAWVKVRRASGDWVGGWFTKGSSATAYPEPESIYIDQQWKMSRNGEYLEPIPNTGVYLALRDDDVIIWTRTSDESE